MFFLYLLSGVFGVIFCFSIVVLIILASIIYPFIKKIYNKQHFKSTLIYNDKDEKYRDVDSNKLKEFDISNINDFKDELYDMFCKFESSYNDLNYNAMRACSTKQLYNNYYTGISVNLRAGLKKIIENISRENVIIYELNRNSTRQIVVAIIEISYSSYMVNSNGEITSGSKDIVKEKFEVTFNKDFNVVSSNCPNCGAPSDREICEFCNTPLEISNFKISKIRRIVE